MAGVAELLILATVLMLIGFRRPISKALGIRGLSFRRFGDVVAGVVFVLTFLAAIAFLAN